MDGHGEAGRLGKDLAQLRMNLHLLEDDLRAVESHNRKEVMARQQDQKLVGLRKEELVALKGRINSLLEEEKNKLRDLNVSLVRAEAALLTHDRSIQDSETKRKRAESTSFDVHREYLEKSMRHHSHARTEDARIKDAHQRVKLESKVRNMQNALKAKMYEVATQQASKGHQLLRRVMTGQRIEKDKKQTKRVLKGAEYLLNYSVDIEKVIKSNIEIANELKKHYERLSELQELKSNQDSQFQDVSANSLPHATSHMYNNPASLTTAELPSLYHAQKQVLPHSPPSSVTEPHQLQPAVYGASTYHRYHLDTAHLRSQSSQRSALKQAAGFTPSRKPTGLSSRPTQPATEPQSSAERSAGSQGHRSARFSHLSTLNPLPSTAGSSTAHHNHHNSTNTMPRHHYPPLPLLPSVSPSRIVGAPPAPHPLATMQAQGNISTGIYSRAADRISPRPNKKKGLSPEPVVPQLQHDDIRDAKGQHQGNYSENERLGGNISTQPSNGLGIREALMQGVKGLDPVNARQEANANNTQNMQRIQSGDSLLEAKQKAQVGAELANALRKMAGLG